MGRKIFRRPYLFMRHRARRMERRLAGAVTAGGVAGAVAGMGDLVEFGGLLGSAPVQPVHPFSARDFVARGGRIPAPMQSLKN